ncbi:hypothetical protein DC20_18490 [Rufibacter tibetensis]|uniref:Uncharacterized protein n=2 Tax=Rufibacter tibetensis TaxID=512763 RepID=A0A0P0CFD9_9BACT|nr:hypothetical protein DC20_18490 [Rufibacter tibetensis]
MNLQAVARGDANVQMFDNRYQGVKGSPYYLDQWVPGSLVMKVGNTGKSESFTGLQLKYDVFSNLLLAVVPQTKDTIQFGISPIISFNLDLSGGGPISFTRIKEAQSLDANLRDAFFGVLYTDATGNTSLVKRIVKKKIDANFKGPYSSGQAYDEIVDETLYYVVANGKMQRVKMNRKSVMEAFPEHAEKLKSYISSQKLAMNSEGDLIKVVSYYQSL